MTYTHTHHCHVFSSKWADSARCVNDGVTSGTIGLAPWVDSRGVSCANYSNRDCRKAADYAVNGVDANNVCCACGGGSDLETGCFDDIRFWQSVQSTTGDRCLRRRFNTQYTST